MPSDAFMEVSSLKIEGESGDVQFGKDTNYGMFEIASFEFNVGDTSSATANSAPASGSTNAKAVPNKTTPSASAGGDQETGKGSFTIKKSIDYASPSLFRRCCHKIAISWAVITFREAGDYTREPWLMLEFRELLMKTFNWNIEQTATAEDSMQMETITFEFEGMLIYYQQQKRDGSHAPMQTGSWDFAKHQVHVDPIGDDEPDKYDDKDDLS